jgi:hypothetical protein
MNRRGPCRRQGERGEGATHAGQRGGVMAAGTPRTQVM